MASELSPKLPSTDPLKISMEHYRALLGNLQIKREPVLRDLPLLKFDNTLDEHITRKDIMKIKRDGAPGPNDLLGNLFREVQPSGLRSYFHYTQRVSLRGCPGLMERFSAPPYI